MDRNQPKTEVKRFECPHCKGGQLENRYGRDRVPVTFRTQRDTVESIKIVHHWERTRKDDSEAENGYFCLNCGMNFGKTRQDVEDWANGRPQPSCIESPDLSLMTVRDFAAELKRRDNLCFAIVWMEHIGNNNIGIEGRGTPTQVVGLLTRGTKLAVEWADKDIKFSTPTD